jgi:hypothetical protein
MLAWFLKEVNATLRPVRSTRVLPDILPLIRQGGQHAKELIEPIKVRAQIGAAGVRFQPA